jgi:hypothetical protein
MEALDVLLAWGGILGRFGVGCLLLLVHLSLPNARNEDGRNNLVLLPDAYKGPGDKVEKPLSWLKDVGIKYNIVEKLSLRECFEA